MSIVGEIVYFCAERTWLSSLQLESLHTLLARRRQLAAQNDIYGILGVGHFLMHEIEMIHDNGRGRGHGRWNQWTG